ncbi:MAG: exodeoxyribonuclease VII large subunit [Kofleriaceae bacterium]|nr:exodeoxyribonuclease VII large subunit [Kofleriaceae bacterium]
MSEERRFASVSRVQSRLRKLLEPALSAAPFWLKAELSSVNHSKGRLYCDLVEMKNGRVVAKMRCTIWPRDLTEIKARLESARLDELLEDGNEVGLRCSIQYHELYGMSVTAIDIDPNESLGALERKKQEMILRLRKENLLGENGKHTVPRLPRRIGLVASRGTAGYKDFVATIASSGYAMTILAADARVEGEDTERSILNALNHLATLDLDLIVILRGGGSRISLSYMDNEAIARAIAGHRYPIWTAIGHEIDTSVIDALAHTSFKTPTAVAEHLVGRYASAEEELRAAVDRLKRAVALRLGPEESRQREARKRLQLGATRLLRERDVEDKNHAVRFRYLVEGRLRTEDARLSQARREISSRSLERHARAFSTLEEARKSLDKTTGRALSRFADKRERLQTRLCAPTALNRLRGEGIRLDAWRQILRAADPVRNLERGYALAYDAAGKVLRASTDAPVGSTVRVRLADGFIVSTVDSHVPATDTEE